MPSFTSAPKYSFEIDGSAYTLPGRSLSLFKQMQSSGVTTDKDGSKTLAFIERVSDKRTAEALQVLTPQDFAELLKDWMGVGEDSRSAQ